MPLLKKPWRRWVLTKGMRSMKRRTVPIYRRRPFPANMFVEWLFLMVIVFIAAILLNRIWMRASEQSEATLFRAVNLPTATIAPSINEAAVTVPTAANSGNPAVTGQVASIDRSGADATTIAPGGLGSIVVGQSAPDFTLPTLEGGEVTLSELRGLAILINFWASWCEPCRVETPLLVSAYRRYADEGLVVLGLNLTEQDRLEDVQAFVSEFDVSYPVLLDDGPEVSHNLFNLIGLPMSVFVDRRGTVKRVIVGAIMDTEIDRYIAEIIGEDY